MTGLIIDNFAGGGGASTGIEMALGRPVDVAINHDEQAVAMHRANHPATRHLCQSVWRADPVEVCRGRPVALAWFSPDCKHFSKAKGGTPVEKHIRDLAWVVVMWAQRVRPAVIMLENVEEFRTWGPLADDGRPCPNGKGKTFEAWQRALRKEGYRLEFRELRACDYGAPTIRKRLFMIARRDGLPIVWPRATHGPADDPDVAAGLKAPWRVAADIIDWSLPCPSIFDTAEEIKKIWGVRAQRPLADATLRRVARGVVKYVLDAPRPFIAPNMTNNVPVSVDEPVSTVTSGNRLALVTPYLTYAQQGGANRSIDDPVHTITASPKDQNCLVAPSLVQMGYGEREGQAPRVLDPAEPLGTVVAGGNKHGLVAAFLAQHNTGRVGHHPDEPVSTLVSKAGVQGVVAANLVTVNHGESGGLRASDAAEPLKTLTARRGDALVATHLQTMRGSSRRDQSADAPLRTVSAGGNHSAVIGAFLSKFYTTGANNHGCDEPIHTVRTKDSCGLVTVDIHGETYAIADIGMRMLTPRERFRAQSFPDSYIIDHGVDAEGNRVALTLDAQGRMCGNSVCPVLAAALVRANVAVAAEQVAA